MIKLTLNGKEIETSCKTLAELIIHHEISLGKIAVEVDGEIVPRSQLEIFTLKEDNAIEIITFVGGG